MGLVNGQKALRLLSVEDAGQAAKMNELMIKRFCGEEVYPLESAAWSIWNSAVICVEMWFEEGKNLHDDTRKLAQAPGWELYFNILPMDEEDVKPGVILEEKDNRADETFFYYCEHLPSRRPEKRMTTSCAFATIPTSSTRYDFYERERSSTTSASARI